MAVAAIPLVIMAAAAATSAISQNQQMKAQAAQADFNAVQEEIRGKEEGNLRREALLKALASQNASYAAAGVDISSGTPANVAGQTQAEGDRDLQIIRTNSRIAAASSRLTAANLRKQARMALLTGGLNAGASLMDYADQSRGIR